MKDIKDISPKSTDEQDLRKVGGVKWQCNSYYIFLCKRVSAVEVTSFNPSPPQPLKADLRLNRH